MIRICAWCSREYAVIRSGPGRPSPYCSDVCRHEAQRALNAGRAGGIGSSTRRRGGRNRSGDGQRSSSVPHGVCLAARVPQASRYTMNADDPQQPQVERAQQEALDKVFRPEHKARIYAAQQRLRATLKRRQAALRQQQEKERLREAAARNE